MPGKLSVERPLVPGLSVVESLDQPTVATLDEGNGFEIYSDLRTYLRAERRQNKAEQGIIGVTQTVEPSK